MTCDGNSQLLKEKWVSILYHTADKHLSVLYNCCAHEPISPRAHRKTKWLIVGSLAHEALKHVVLEKTLLKDLYLLTKTIHTGALEVYHSLYSKYAPKWQHFGYLGMVVRTQLTALGHNSGTCRSQAEALSRKKWFRYVYPKGMPMVRDSSNLTFLVFLILVNYYLFMRIVLLSTGNDEDHQVLCNYPIIYFRLLQR